MTNSELKFFGPETGKPLHRVPEGVTIPAGTPYGFMRSNGNRGWVVGGGKRAFDQLHGNLRFTREPIAPPKPPLPTKPGSTIRAVNKGGGECSIMTRSRSDYWYGVGQNGTLRSWYDSDIREWEPVAIVPTETWDRLRVLDPEDKRDRVDRDGDLIRLTTQSKVVWGAELAERHFNYGPLRFADEVSDDA